MNQDHHVERAPRWIFRVHLKGLVDDVVPQIVMLKPSSGGGSSLLTLLDNPPLRRLLTLLKPWRRYHHITPTRKLPYPPSPSARLICSICLSMIILRTSTP